MIPKLYETYFIAKMDERRELFLKIAQTYHPKRGLYPGSFVHITPSFYIEDMTYIDSDKRVEKFFSDPILLPFVKQHTTYNTEPVITGFQDDYSAIQPHLQASFDIMFSFYAGFISQICKVYLKPKAILVCNNSHGDSSLAAVDPDYQLIGVIKRRGEKFTLSHTNLETYCIKKDGTQIDSEKVRRKMIGEHFTKTPFAYIFQYLPQ